MRIASVASAFPEHYYDQQVLTEALKNDWRHRLPNPDILDRLDESMKVEGRYLVRTIDFYESLTTWGQANNEWIEHALELGEKALVQGATRRRHEAEGS
jgi:alkylresorcinol/alkylpyrone synthase